MLWFADPEWGRAGLGAVVTEIFAGREGGVQVSTAGGVPVVFVFALSATQDLAAFFLTYPLFLMYLRRNKDKDNFLMRRVRRIEAAALHHEAYVRRWGPVGLFLFMLIPFTINGPLVGGVLGRIAGIPTRRLLLPVVAAALVGAAAWAFFAEQTVGRLRDVDPRLGYLISALIVAGIIVAGSIAVVRDERKAAAARNDIEE